LFNGYSKNRPASETELIMCAQNQLSRIPCAFSGSIHDFQDHKR
jgi:hypothetical protein